MTTGRQPAPRLEPLSAPVPSEGMGCGPPDHKVWLVTKQPLRFGPIRTKIKTATAYPHRSRRCGRAGSAACSSSTPPRPPRPPARHAATSNDVSTTTLGAWYATRLHWRRPISAASSNPRAQPPPVTASEGPWIRQGHRSTVPVSARIGRKTGWVACFRTRDRALPLTSEKDPSCELRGVSAHRRGRRITPAVSRSRNVGGLGATGILVDGTEKGADDGHIRQVRGKIRRGDAVGRWIRG